MLKLIKNSSGYICTDDVDTNKVLWSKKSGTTNS